MSLLLLSISQYDSKYSSNDDLNSFDHSQKIIIAAIQSGSPCGHHRPSVAGLPAPGGKSRKDHVEGTEPVPMDDQVVNQLGPPVCGASIAPPRANADHEGSAARDTPIIAPRHALRQREMPLDPTHPRLATSDNMATPSHVAIEQVDHRIRKINLDSAKHLYNF